MPPEKTTMTEKDKAEEDKKIDEVLAEQEKKLGAKMDVVALPVEQALADLPRPSQNLEFELPPDDQVFIPPLEVADKDDAKPTDWRGKAPGTLRRWAKVHHEGSGAFMGHSGGGAVKVAMCPNCVFFQPTQGAPGSGLCSSAVPEEIRQKPDFKVCSNARRIGV